MEPVERESSNAASDRAARIVCAALGVPAALVVYTDRTGLPLGTSGPVPGAARRLAERVAARGEALQETAGDAVFLGVPVRRGEKSIGCVAAVAEAPHAWPPHARALLEDVAAGVAREAALETAVASARSRAVSERLASERRLHDIVGVMPDLFFRLTRDGLHLEAHAADTAQLAVPLESIVGRTVDELLPPDVAALWRDAVVAALDEGALVELDYSLVAVDGRMHRYEARILPAGPDEVQAVIRDVTEQDETARALAASEARFRTFVEATTQLVWTANAHGEVAELNPAWRALTGQPTGASLDWREALHPEERSAVLSAWGAHVAACMPYEDEFRVQRRDGTYGWFSARAVPVQGPDGAFVEWVGTLSDVTARREAAAAVERARLRYRRLVNGIDGVVWEGRVERRTGASSFTFISERLRDLLGYEPEAWCADPSEWLAALVEEDRARVPEGRADALLRGRGNGRAEGRDFVQEYRMRAADGRIVWLRDAVSVIAEEPEGAVVVGIAIDITDHMRYEAALRAARQEAEAAARLKASFLNNMSHEIRTPLTTVIGFADLLAEEAEGPVREPVRMIQEGGRRLLITLNSVLDLARLESGIESVRLRPVEVTGEAAEVVRLFRRQAAEKGLSISLEAPSEAWALADAGGVQRVLMNLISNAVKFTASGGVSVRVAVDEAAVDEVAGKEGTAGVVTIEVTDSGMGMDDDFLAAAFEPFRQESEGLARKYEGSGLGLAIVAQLVTLMRGTVAAESVKGRGTTLRIRLPRHAAAAAPARVPDAEAPAPRPPADAARRPAVLVVEDDANVRALLSVMLQERYEVDIAATAEAALERTGPYAVALVDINLGRGMGGVELMHTLRRRPGYDGVPVVAVTAQALPGDRERMLDLGFDAYLSKPFRKHDLLSIVHDAMRAADA